MSKQATSESKSQSRSVADKEQSRRFIETAREVEADEESSPADTLLGRLAKRTPEPRKPAGE
jgi:hypothetical protein